MTSPAVCPDAELLAACAEGLLQGTEREQVFRHVLSCADCSSVFTDTLHALDEPSPGLERVVEGIEAGRRALGVGADRAGAASAFPPPPIATPAVAGSGGVARFTPRRWAPAVLPLAAGLLFGLWLASSRDAVTPGPGPQVAGVASPSPASSQREPAAVALLDQAKLPEDALPPIEPPNLAFGGLGRTRLCHFLGAQSVVIEARARVDSRQVARDRNARDLGRLAVLAESRLPQQTVEQYRRLSERLQSERQVPTADDLRPRAECDGYALGRAVGWVRLASVGDARNRDLLAHSEVARVLDGGRPAEDRDARGIAALARLTQACIAAASDCKWPALQEQAVALEDGWRP